MDGASPGCCGTVGAPTPLSGPTWPRVEKRAASGVLVLLEKSCLLTGSRRRGGDAPVPSCGVFTLVDPHRLCRSLAWQGVLLAYGQQLSFWRTVRGSKFQNRTF